MTTPLTDAQSLARSHQRRRWVIRLSLVALLTLLLLFIAGLALTSSSGLSIEEARVQYNRLGMRATLEHVESVFGVPSEILTYDDCKHYHWVFAHQSIDKIDYFVVLLLLKHGAKDGRITNPEWTVTGWDLWESRWKLLKGRLGFPVDVMSL